MWIDNEKRFPFCKGGSSKEETPLVFNMSRALSQVKHHFLLWKQVVTTRHLGQTGKAGVTMVR